VTDFTDGGDPWDTNATDPTVPTTFPLSLTNNGDSSDSYDITVDDSNLPPGTVVEITLADGTPITNTGSIPAGGSEDVVVTVTPPAGAPVATDTFDVTVSSPTSGNGDTITNALTVNPIVDVAIEEDQTVQAAPGGIVDIPHILTNEGNVDVFAGSLTLGGSLSSFAGTLFLDVNGNQIADTGDVVIDDISDIVTANSAAFAPGDQENLILRVQVPSTATVGLTEVETINVGSTLMVDEDGDPTNAVTAATDSDPANNAVDDQITIVSGDLTLVKTQAIDPNCDGTPGTFTISSVNANPGECIAYQITAENTGTTDADDVTITDATPTWTTYTTCAPFGGSCVASAAGGAISGSISNPGGLTEGFTGTVEGIFDTLVPGDDATLSFTVRIDE